MKQTTKHDSNVLHDKPSCNMQNVVLRTNMHEYLHMEWMHVATCDNYAAHRLHCEQLCSHISHLHCDTNSTCPVIEFAME